MASCRNGTVIAQYDYDMVFFFFFFLNCNLLSLAIAIRHSYSYFGLDLYVCKLLRVHVMAVLSRPVLL